jgi:PAS domain S-box-containing protein
VRIFASIRTIPDSPWAIVTKIDRHEILEPVTKRVGYVVGTCILIVLATFLAFSLWWRRKKEAYLLQQYDSELEFNRELKQAEHSLQEVNSRLEERVARRTEELSTSNTKLRQEIEERKQVEELLRKHFHVIQQSPIAIIITDLNGGIEFVNPRFSEYSGYSYEEVIGQNPRFLKSDLTPPAVYKELWETITTGQTWNGEFCNRKKNGEIYWEYATILPFKGQEGQITNYMAFKEDITTHKQLEDKLAQSRKLETIGQIAGGVAHEVRNPLNAILSITEALFREKEIDNNPEFTPYIQHIRTQVNRLADLMNDLLDLGKPIASANFQALPLLEHCRETTELWTVSGSAKAAKVHISTDPEATDIQVTADSGRLQQVIFNLLENAGNHSPAESTILIRLGLSTTSPDTAIVEITDSGRGIPEESLCRVFEPFYSDRRGGTGLGLSLVKHFIENMGGSVRIWNNEPSPGCTAELRIPLAVKEQS